MTDPAPDPVPAASNPAAKPSFVARHPNALVSLGSGSGVGTLAVWALSHWTTLPPEAATVIGGAVGALALFVGRNGLHGLVELVKHGTGG